MSYFNFKLCEERGIHPSKLISLVLLNQARSEDLSATIEGYMGAGGLKMLHEEGLVTYVKAKRKSDTLYMLARLSDKGKELLEALTTPEVTDGDIQMYDYLCEMYMKNEDTERTLGNKKLGRIYCAQFRQLMGLSLHEMFYLCELFVAEQKFTKVLEYVFFSKRENPYGKFKDNLESSKLYQFYQDNKQKVEEYWKQRIKE